MFFPRKEVVDRIKAQYPAGCRVELISMSDPYRPMPEGLHVGMWKRNGKALYVLGNQTDRDLEVGLPSGRMTVPAQDLRFYPDVK